MDTCECAVVRGDKPLHAVAIEGAGIDVDVVACLTERWQAEVLIRFADRFAMRGVAAQHRHQNRAQHRSGSLVVQHVMDRAEVGEAGGHVPGIV